MNTDNLYSIFTRASTANWLIQVTLLKISNRVVSRTLSIPASVTFFDLHHATEAASGWDGDDTTADYGDEPFPLVKVVKGNPFRAEAYDLMPALFSMQLSDEVDGIPGAECDNLEYANVPQNSERLQVPRALPHLRLPYLWNQQISARHSASGTHAGRFW